MERGRRLLRAAAAAPFGEFGAAAVGLDRVALAARMGRSSGYCYFTNREELLYEVVAYHAIDLQAAVCAAFDATAGEGQATRLEPMVRAWMDHVAAHRDAHRCLVVCGHLLGPDLRS